MNDEEILKKAEEVYALLAAGELDTAYNEIKTLKPPIDRNSGAITSTFFQSKTYAHLALKLAEKAGVNEDSLGYINEELEKAKNLESNSRTISSASQLFLVTGVMALNFYKSKDAYSEVGGK